MNKTRVPLLRAFAVALSVAAPLSTPAAARSAATAARPAVTVDACSWDRPGNDPFMGDVVAAVDRYQDIAPDVRQRLKARMVRRDYDDVVSIRRDSIQGRAQARYGSAIHDMHFGRSRLCRTVSRAAWTEQMQERGLVYCESGQCILVPTVCRNVSRIARAERGPERAEGDALDLGIPPVAALDLLPLTMPLDLLMPVLALSAGSSLDPALGGHVAGGGGHGGSVMGGGGAGSFSGGSGGSGGGPGVRPLAADPDGEHGWTPGAAAPASAPISPVPEPETWAVMAAGLAALAAWRRRRPTAAARAAGPGTPCRPCP